MDFNQWIDNLKEPATPEQLIEYSSYIQTLVKLEGQTRTAKKLNMSQAKLSHQLEILKELAKPSEVKLQWN